MIRKTDIPQPIVAMNIGSSGVRAIAADWDEKHQVFHILDSESCANRHQCVEKGIMVPFPNTSSQLSSVTAIPATTRYADSGTA